MTGKYRVMYRAKKPDGIYTATLELFAIHAMLDDVGTNEDTVLENWMEKNYDIEKWDNATGTWREW